MIFIKSFLYRFIYFTLYNFTSALFSCKFFCLFFCLFSCIHILNLCKHINKSIFYKQFLIKRNIKNIKFVFYNKEITNICPL